MPLFTLIEESVQSLYFQIINCDNNYNSDIKAYLKYNKFFNYYL